MRKFPIVQAKGSHYEVGVAIGKTMNGAIKRVLSKSRVIFQKDFSIRLQRSKLFQKHTQKYFPQYIDELRGIAEGAKVSFDELFLSNNREVADFDPFLLDPNHCTILGIPSKGGYLLGHNEDWDITSLSHIYVLDSVTAGTRIFGLNYANTLIGCSVACNEYGIVQAVNELSQQDESEGVPKNFIARALLDCKTLEDTEKIMKIIPRASGFNHVLSQGDQLWNIESIAKEYVIEKCKLQKYVHTNHYLSEFRRVDKGNLESERRYAKVKGELGNVNSVEDIKGLLSDHADPRICREGTIGSVIFDIPNKVAHIAYGQPTSGAYVEYSLEHVVR